MPSKSKKREKLFRDEMSAFLKEVQLVGAVYVSVTLSRAYLQRTDGPGCLAVILTNSAWGVSVLPANGEYRTHRLRLDSPEKVRAFVKAWMADPDEVYNEAYGDGAHTSTWWVTADYPYGDHREHSLKAELARADIKDMRRRSPVQKAMSKKPREIYRRGK